MGWSCRADAWNTADTWKDQCLGQVRTDGEKPYQNGYLGKDGNRYFFQNSRTEHDDGAITGTTYRYLPDGEHVRKSGTFRIEGDGSVTRYPTAWPFKKNDRTPRPANQARSHAAGLLFS